MNALQRHLGEQRGINVVGMVDDLAIGVYGSHGNVIDKICTTERLVRRWLRLKGLPVNSGKCVWIAAQSRTRATLTGRWRRRGYLEVHQHRHLGGQVSAARRRYTGVAASRMRKAHAWLARLKKVRAAGVTEC
eukprot:4366206-Amphidinium_carterae.1